MRRFSDYNPLAIAIYYFIAVGIAMFGTDPLLSAISLIGSVLLFVILRGNRDRRSHVFSACLLIGMALINPLVSHNGVTVLFVINNAPITLEACLYGLVASATIVAVLYWFRSFSHIMTEDKLLYIFGALSPKLALIVSMAMRYVPLFRRQAKQVTDAQRVLGLYRDGNLIDRFRGGLKVSSAMITWGLENGIITADSMTARGYGIGKRTHASLFRFQTHDLILLSISLLLGALTLYGLRNCETVYYPAFCLSPVTATGILGYSAYALLALWPAIIEVKEAIQWRYLRSRI